MNDLVRRFIEFDTKNPHVWAQFQRFAFQMIERGRTVLSAKLIFERIRWETTIETNSDDELKLCNNHTAYYARKFHEVHPNVPAKFRTKKVRGDAFAGWKPHEPQVEQQGEMPWAQ